jgi:hypothetical protein
MRERLAQELELLRKHFPEVEYMEEGWFKIPNYPLTPGWNRVLTDVVFWARPEYPGTPPYGIYVPVGIQYNGQPPKNYTAPPSPAPPFAGEWGIFSWSVAAGWRATADLVTGSNLVNWARGIAERFREGE